MLYFAMPPRSFLSYDYQNDKDSISNVVTTEKTKFEAECQTQFDDNNDLDEQWMNLVKQMDNDRSHITYNLSELALSFCDKLLEMSNDVFPWTNDVTYQFLATVVGISRWISKITPCSGDCTDSNKEALDKLNFYSKKWKRGVETKNPGKTQYLFFLNYDFVANLSDFTQNFPTASHEQQTSMIQTLVLQLIFLFETGFKFQSAAIELFELAQNTIDSVSQENSGSDNEVVMLCNICLHLIRVGIRLLPSFSVKALKKVEDERFSKTFLPESDDLFEVLLNNLAKSLSKLRHSPGTGNGDPQIKELFKIVEHENKKSYEEYQKPEFIEITETLRLPLKQIDSSELAEFETERSQILKVMEFCMDILAKEKFKSVATELYELAENKIKSMSSETLKSNVKVVSFCNMCLNLVRVGIGLLPPLSVKAQKEVGDEKFSETFLPESRDLSEVLLNNLAESLSKLRHSFGTGNGHAQIQKIFEIVEHENQESYQEYQPPEKKNSQTEEPPSIKITRSLRLPLRQINSSELAEFETERSQILKLMEFCVDVLTKEKTEISSDYYIEPIIIGEEKTELAPGHDSKPNTV
jgi:hypothetical protein